MIVNESGGIVVTLMRVDGSAPGLASPKWRGPFSEKRPYKEDDPGLGQAMSEDKFMRVGCKCNLNGHS